MTPPGTTSAGLCQSCLHTRIIETRTGSTFFLCERSAVDPAFPRYPRLPVLRCPGYVCRDGTTSGDADPTTHP